jgi:hypothetical protein
MEALVWQMLILLYLVVSVVRNNIKQFIFLEFVNSEFLFFFFSLCYFEHVDFGLDIIAFWLVKMARRCIKKKNFLRNINHPQ